MFRAPPNYGNAAGFISLLCFELKIKKVGFNAVQDLKFVTKLTSLSLFCPKKVNEIYLLIILFRVI